jgi:hypothetical protein
VFGWKVELNFSLEESYVLKEKERDKEINQKSHTSDDENHFIILFGMFLFQKKRVKF